MIRLKTSVLLGCALKIGALVGGAAPSEADKLYRFGESIGIAFQIQDDLLDAFADNSKFGKTQGGDILQDKKTLLMLHTQEHASAAQQEILSQDYKSDTEKIAAISRLFKESGSTEYATGKMKAYYREALKNLDEVAGDPAIKLELAKFAEWLIRRDI